MALKPSPSSCLKNSCGQLVVTDGAGVYHVTNNPYGWGTPNIQGSDVTEAVITITWPSGESEEYNVTDEVPDTVTGDIEYNIIEADFPDGIYTININYTTSTGTYSKTIKKLYTCHAQCCVDKMWAKLPEKFYNLSDEQFLAYSQQAQLASAWLTSINAAGGCLKTDIVSDVLERVQRICDFEKCNCD
jgi:hypothetical protein